MSRFTDKATFLWLFLPIWLYTFQKSNVVLIHEFKEYYALLFFKADLLNDANEILIQQTENVQAGRQISIFETIEVEKGGLKTAFDTLTQRRIRAYLLHFSVPKQSKIRELRVENCMRKILNLKGLNE